MQDAAFASVRDFPHALMARVSNIDNRMQLMLRTLQDRCQMLQTSPQNLGHESADENGFRSSEYLEEQHHNNGRNPHHRREHNNLTADAVDELGNRYPRRMSLLSRDDGPVETYSNSRQTFEVQASVDSPESEDGSISDMDFFSAFGTLDAEAPIDPYRIQAGDANETQEGRSLSEIISDASLAGSNASHRTESVCMTSRTRRVSVDVTNEMLCRPISVLDLQLPVTPTPNHSSEAMASAPRINGAFRTPVVAANETKARCSAAFPIAGTQTLAPERKSSVLLPEVLSNWNLDFVL